MSTSGKLIFLHGDQSREETIRGLIGAGALLVGIVLGFVIGINERSGPPHLSYSGARYQTLRYDARQECLWNEATQNDNSKQRLKDYNTWVRTVAQYDKDLRMFEQRYGLGPTWQVMAKEVC